MDSTRESTRKRGGNHPENLRPCSPWKPGESGNKQGSSKKARILKAFREYVTESDNEAVAAVIRQRAKHGVPFFVETFLDRTQGKVPSKNEITGAEGKPVELNINVVSDTGKKILSDIVNDSKGDCTVDK